MAESLNYELVNWLLWAAKTGVTWAVGVFVMALVAYVVALVIVLVKARKAHEETLARVREDMAQRRRRFVGDPHLPE